MSHITQFVIFITLLPSFVNANEFHEYPSKANLITEFAVPRITDGNILKYRTLLTNEAKKGPNYSSYLRVVHWGCGTNCASWAIINLINGRVLFPSESLVSCAPQKTSQEVIPDWIESHVNSRLLYVYTCSDFPFGDYTFNLRKVFVWEENNLKLIRVEKVSF